MATSSRTAPSRNQKSRLNPPKGYTAARWAQFLRLGIEVLPALDGRSTTPKEDGDGARLPIILQPTLIVTYFPKEGPFTRVMEVSWTEFAEPLSESRERLFIDRAGESEKTAVDSTSEGSGASA